MQDLELKGRVALITGGAGGIGRAIARRLAAAGARVALADLRLEETERLADELKQAGHAAIALAGDVSRPADAAALVARTVSGLGRVDILVNNAGIMGRVAPLEDVSDDDWRRVMSVDLDSVFFMSRAVISHMKHQGGGCIVSIASIAGKEGTPSLVPYSVAKAGIIALTKALGKELVGSNIRVNCVAPGVVHTALLDQLPRESIDRMLSRVPMQRFGTVEEVAAVVHFLASDAASFITAQCLDASGGRATY